MLVSAIQIYLIAAISLIALHRFPIIPGYKYCNYLQCVTPIFWMMVASSVLASSIWLIYKLVKLVILHKKEAKLKYLILAFTALIAGLLSAILLTISTVFIFYSSGFVGIILLFTLPILIPLALLYFFLSKTSKMLSKKTVVHKEDLNNTLSQQRKK